MKRVVSESIFNMTVSDLISALQAGALSNDAKVLTNSTTAEFQELMKRWTDVDKQTPFAIVMPATEEDIVKSVSLNLRRPKLSG